MSMRAPAPVAVVLGALVLSACGGGSSGTTSHASAPATSAGTGSASTADAPTRFRDGLIADKGFTEEQATCIEKGVLKKIGRKQFERLYGKGNTPERVRIIIFRVAAKCAPRGPGQ
jgi:hypothetical protein